MESLGFDRKVAFSFFAIIALVLGGIFLLGFLNSGSKPTAIHEALNSEDSKHEYTFNAWETPKFSFASVAYASDIASKTTVYDSKGNKIDAKVTVVSDGKGSSISLSEMREFRPGKYKIVVEQNGRKIEQDFNWGVLAINPDKSIYLPNEMAKLDLAVLDEKGLMVCEGAVITLVIKSPTGEKTVLSNQDGTITQNPECKLKQYTSKPDYETTYKVGGVGTYEMILSAITRNGTFNITDFFKVQESVDFDIQRQGPTRIFPYSLYPVSMNMTANKDFTGSIKEAIPSSFTVLPLSGTIPNTRIEKNGNIQYLVWDITLEKGKKIKLGYIFKAPIISPEFYLLGPLSFYDKETLIFKENRAWQIAADAISLQETDSGTIESATATVTSVTTSSNSTAVTNDLYLTVVSTKPNVTIGTPTGLGLTWTLVNTVCGDRNQTNSSVYRALGTPSGDGTVTSTVNGGVGYVGGAAIAVFRYTGVDTGTPIGATEIANTAGVGGAVGVCDGVGTDNTAFSFSTFDTTQANSVVFVAVGDRNRTLTQGTGWTLDLDIHSGLVGGINAGIGVEEQLFASQTNNLTIDGTFDQSVDWGLIAAEIMIGGAAPTDTPTPGANFRFNGLQFNGIKLN